MNTIVRLGAFLLITLVVTTGNAQADPALESAVNATFPTRTQDARLHELAHQRAVEIASDFNHNAARYAEVIAWNEGYPDPVSRVIHQWLNSPDHAAILLDPRMSLIGCGTHVEGDRTFAACLLAAGSAPDGDAETTPTGATPVPIAPAPAPTSAPVTAPGPAGQPSNVDGSGAQRTPLPVATPPPALPDTSMP